MDAPSELKKRKPRNRSQALSTSRLIASKQAAAYLGIPYSSLRDQAHRGELETVRVGRLIYFERRGLDQWIEANKARAGQ
jgi:excisionase family DNA binding protein